MNNNAKNYVVKININKALVDTINSTQEKLSDFDHGTH